MTRLELESFGFLSRWFLRLPDNDLTRYHTFWIVFRSLLFIFIFAFVLAFVVVFAIQTRVAKTVGEACCCCAMWFPRVIIEIGYSSVVVFTFYDWKKRSLFTNLLLHANKNSRFKPNNLFDKDVFRLNSHNFALQLNEINLMASKFHPLKN
jgi:hypothetical protein